MLLEFCSPKIQSFFAFLMMPVAILIFGGVPYSGGRGVPFLKADFGQEFFAGFYAFDQQLYQQAVQFHNLFSTVFLPLLLSLLAVLYIKRVHDQCDLYFGKEWR